MDRLKERLRVAQEALATFIEALNVEKPSSLERDGTIQRFEYTFETCWKACQRYLYIQEGSDCASPKSCLRGIGKAGILDEAQTVAALKMTDDRNRTTHIYHEKIAEEIYSRLPKYQQLIGVMLDGMQKNMQQE